MKIRMPDSLTINIECLMKKILTAIALLAALCACNKEKELVSKEDQAPDTGKQIITATVNVASKVAYSENTPGGGGGISSVWEEGDTFYAIQDGSSVVTFTLSNGAGNSTAEFTAETEGATASTSWVAVLGKNASVHGTEIHCGYQSQNGTIAHLNNFNYVKATATGLEPVFDFDAGEKLSYVMRVKLPAGIKTVEYTSPAYYKVESSATSTVYAKGENDPYKNIPTSTITLSSASSAGDLVYIAVPAIDHSHSAWTYNSGKQYGNLRTGVIVTILNDNSANATASTGAVMTTDLRSKGGQIGTYDFTEYTLLKRPKVSDAITVSSSQVCYTRTGLTQTVETLETGWAPYNIGAEQPYELGNYYAFGESQPKSSYTNVNYSLRAPAAMSGRPDYLAIKVTSPSPNSYFTTDGGRYDTARVLWGSAWRMPNICEFLALDPLKGHSVTISTISGQKCYVSEGVTLPIGGYINDTTVSHDGDGTNSDFVAWSTTIINQAASNAGWDAAYAFDASLQTPGPGKERVGKCYGMPVRAVLASSVFTLATQTYSY